MKLKLQASTMDADDLFKDIDDLGIEIDNEEVITKINERKNKIKAIEKRNKVDFRLHPPIDEPEFNLGIDPAELVNTNDKVRVDQDQELDQDPNGPGSEISIEEEWENEDTDEEYDAPLIKSPVRSLTELARLLRNNGFKISVFNVKDTLIRYLELFGERKIARHVLDQDGYKFYEIHALYIPGGMLFSIMTKLGFKPLHPTDLDPSYPKDMRYEVAMSNGQVHINIFGGLQQHAPTEETVIRNLYEWETKRYGIGIETGTSVSSTFNKVREDEIKELAITKNLVLAAMQSHALNKPELSYEFFKKAMHSAGIDRFIDSLAKSSFERQPYFAEVSDFITKKNKDIDELTDDERSIYLEPQDAGDLFQVE